MRNAQVPILAEFSHFHSKVMVNDKFPTRRPYGFESVHAQDDVGKAREPVINGKFTPNRMKQIFIDLTASQILAVYRPLIVSIPIALNRIKVRRD